MCARRALDHVIHHTQLHGLHGNFFIAGTGQHHHGAGKHFAAFVQKADHFQAVKIRKVQIQKNAVGLEFPQPVEAFLSGSGLGVDEGARAVRIEILFENLTIDWLVVDDQDVEHVGH